MTDRLRMMEPFEPGKVEPEPVSEPAHQHCRVCGFPAAGRWARDSASRERCPSCGSLRFPRTDA